VRTACRTQLACARKCNAAPRAKQGVSSRASLARAAAQRQARRGAVSEDERAPAGQCGCHVTSETEPKPPAGVQVGVAGTGSSWSRSPRSSGIRPSEASIEAHFLEARAFARGRVADARRVQRRARQAQALDTPRGRPCAAFSRRCAALRLRAARRGFRVGPRGRTGGNGSRQFRHFGTNVRAHSFAGRASAASDGRRGSGRRTAKRARQATGGRRVRGGCSGGGGKEALCRHARLLRRRRQRQRRR
jgi:hypothetical protein